MEALTHMLIALGVVVVPLLLAWWLLARGAVRGEQRQHHDPPTRDNMDP